jgi:hypothetical protein
MKKYAIGFGKKTKPMFYVKHPNIESVIFEEFSNKTAVYEDEKKAEWIMQVLLAYAKDKILDCETIRVIEI